MIYPDFLENNTSTVIKGMKTPQSCDECIFDRNNGPYPGVICMFSSHVWPDKPRTKEEPRLDFCPLGSAADVVEVRRGEWLPVDEKMDAFDCSECDAMVMKPYNYCPKCGARMDRGKDE